MTVDDKLTVHACLGTSNDTFKLSGDRMTVIMHDEHVLFMY